MARAKGEKLTPGLKALVDIRSDGWLVNKVEAYMEADQSGNRVDPGWFHPSDLSNPCDAYLAFAFLGSPKNPKIDPRLRRIFDNGHGRDLAWKRYLRDAGLSVIPERRAPCGKCGDQGPLVNGKRIGVDGRHICIPELRIRGECDDFVLHPFDKSYYVFEFKTKNDALFKKLTEPDADHRIQVQPYMYAKQAARAIILYENKNDQQLKPFVVHFDEQLWADITERVQRIIYQLGNDQTPERTPSKYETSCTYFPICSTANFVQLVDEYRERQGLSNTEESDGKPD